MHMQPTFQSVPVVVVRRLRQALDILVLRVLSIFISSVDLVLVIISPVQKVTIQVVLLVREA